MRQNSVQISGFVCKPEVRQFANSAVCRFNLGISRIEKKGEESVTNTAYLPVEVWKADASDLVSLTKGANVGSQAGSRLTATQTWMVSRIWL